MKTTNPRAGVLVGCVMLLGAGGVCARDWPQWRGPNRDARATGFKAPATWPKELTRKWEVTVGEGVTLGVRGVLSCLDAASGKKVWRKDDFEGSWPRFFAASSQIIVGRLCI